MPVEAKPLFRPDVLQPYLRAFAWPPANLTDIKAKLRKWADLFQSRRGDKFNEKELLPDFLTDVFCDVLGYTRPADNAERYTFSREKYVEVDGKVADAVMGQFKATGNEYVIALEGKGPLDPLDRPHAGRKMSAVDQGYRYAINLPAEWIIVTSMRQTRLYHKGSNQYTYERFDIDRMMIDYSHLKKFLFLLGADRVCPPSGKCHFTDLLFSSSKVGKELTRDYYARYAEVRERAFAQLCSENPSSSRHELLTATQKLIDRVLFISFCEDRGLLPLSTIRNAYEHRDPYHPRPIWDNFRGLFRAIDTGNTSLNIPAYNGGLFALDPVLDALSVTDEVCGYFRDLADYDYRPASTVSEETDTAGKLIDVDILGHIFEQSITDLERIRNELDGRETPKPRDKEKTRRKKEGAFYTPAFITRYIVEQALGGVLKDRFEALRSRLQSKAKGTARTALANPSVYDLETMTAPQSKALVEFWEAWQDELKTVRVLDPACGSGAFLIETFDQLHTFYQTSNDRLEELRGSRSLFDPDRQILQHNLYGVDLNDEAIEICRLSLWIKTAARGKVLTSLDHTIRVGNSVVTDPAVHPRAFDWRAAFPEVFEQGGFDVVVGNPPYIRQEWITPIKSYLQANYLTFDSSADLYVYFYELGCRVLKSGGRLSFVVTNKWMKVGYGEPLRRFFAEHAWVESVVDFGHAKQIFEDADVFPSIVVVRKPTDNPKPKSVRVCEIPREQLRVDDLSSQISDEGFEVAAEQLGSDSWRLDSDSVSKLVAKLLASSEPLSSFENVQPMSGIKTGFNDAYLIDSDARKALLKADPSCEYVIRPYLRGQDFGRWEASWAGLWMIVMKSSDNFDWPWANAGENAETVFAQTFPAIHAHLSHFRETLNKRQDQGRYWWELRSCAYWRDFDKPKIIYPEITWRTEWCFDTKGTLLNNTAYILPTINHWVLAVANSPINWWYSWRNAVHGKDEALRFIKEYVKTIPIPSPTNAQREAAKTAVERLIHISNSQHEVRRTMLDWLRVEFEIEKPSLKIQNPVALDSDALVAEVKKLRGKKKPLTAAGLKALRDEDLQTIAPARALAAETLLLESEINDLVNAAYGLTPEDVRLMWDTAPPRMPIPRPKS